jgi:DnaJ-domain-containing protein 1
LHAFHEAPRISFMPPFVRVQLDHYSVLQIDPSADLAAVNAAFRRLAWRYHPDRNPAPGATMQFQDINEAHQVLSHPERRAEYDAQCHSFPREHLRPVQFATHTHAHRSPHGRRRIRTMLLTLFAFLLVAGAWAVMLAAVSLMHSAAADYVYDVPPPFNTDPLQSSAISMEMYPVTYTDEGGQQSTAWDIDVRNCWGWSIWVSSIPILEAQRAFGTLASALRLSRPYELKSSSGLPIIGLSPWRSISRRQRL